MISKMNRIICYVGVGFGCASLCILPPFQFPVPFNKRRVLLISTTSPATHHPPPSSLLISPLPLPFLFLLSLLSIFHSPLRLSDLPVISCTALPIQIPPVAQHNRLNRSSISPGGVRSTSIPSPGKYLSGCVHPANLIPPTPQHFAQHSI